MAKKISVEIPEYFSVKHYKSLGSFEHLDESEKIVATIVATTEHSQEDVMRWNITDLLSVYKGVSGMVNDVNGEFYPVFEFRDIKYGFVPLSKMDVATWIDLDARLKDPVGNLESILAICYRPIVKEKFDGMEWKAKSFIKTLIGKPENLFKYYEVEEYDNEKRTWREEIFQDLPIEYASGALTFFLIWSLVLQRDLIAYSPMKEETRKGLMMEIDKAIKGLQSQTISDGYIFSETLIQESSLTLQEKSQ